MFAIAPFFPRIYNTTEEVRGLAKQFIRMASACMPLYGFMHATYFTLLHNHIVDPDFLLYHNISDDAFYNLYQLTG